MVFYVVYVNLIKFFVVGDDVRYFYFFCYYGDIDIERFYDDVKVFIGIVLIFYCL